MKWLTRTMLCVSLSICSIQGQSKALVQAAAKGDIATVRSLLAHGVNPNQVDNSVVKGWTPLMAAAKKGSVEITKALLQAHATVRAKNEFGGTALSIAETNHGASSAVAVVLLAAESTTKEKAGNKFFGRLQIVMEAPTSIGDLHQASTSQKFYLLTGSGKYEIVRSDDGAKMPASFETCDDHGFVCGGYVVTGTITKPAKQGHIGTISATEMESQ